MPQYKFLLDHAQNFPTEGVPPSPFAYSAPGPSPFKRDHSVMREKTVKRKRDLLKVKSRQSTMSILDRARNKFVSRQEHSYGRRDVVGEKSKLYKFVRVKKGKSDGSMYNVVQLDNKNNASLMKESTAGKGPPQVLYKDKKYVPTRINPAAYGGLHEFMLRGNSVKLWYGVEDLNDFFPNMKEYNNEYANKFLHWVDAGKVRVNPDTGRAFKAFGKKMTK